MSIWYKYRWKYYLYAKISLSSYSLRFVILTVITKWNVLRTWTICLSYLSLLTIFNTKDALKCHISFHRAFFNSLSTEIPARVTFCSIKKYNPFSFYHNIFMWFCFSYVTSIRHFIAKHKNGNLYTSKRNAVRKFLPFKFNSNIFNNKGNLATLILF